MTEQEYYSNQDNWGNFITLENVIDNIMMTAGDDSYFKNIKRHQYSIYAKQGLKKLNLDVGGNVKTMAMELQPTKIIPYPQYMLDWHRVSVITDCGSLKELTVNNTPATEHYLQDHNGDLLFDHDGNVLQAHDENIEHATCLPTQCTSETTDDNNFNSSWAKDKGKYFEFSDDLEGRIIVIEYTISSLTSIKDCDIKISDKLELALDNYIRYNALRDMRNVPNIVWREYYQTYKVEKTRAKSLMNKKLSVIQIVSAINLRF